MMAIVELEGGKITAWMIGSDADDLRRRAQASQRQDVARYLYNMPPDFLPQVPKMEIFPGVFLLRQ